MAIVTVVATGDMRRVFAGGGCTIVTSSASSQDLGMINIECRRPGVRVVAILANISREYVVGILSRGLNPVMATDTVSSDVDMVKVGWNPAGRRVTIVAGIAAGDMRRMFTSRDNAVVAGSAGTHYLGMVDRNHRFKADRRMAIFTNVGCEDMQRAFAGRGNAVVAGHAIANNTGVIEYCRLPCNDGVAVIAGIARRNVIKGLASRLQAIVTTHATTCDR
jgi:hypothetical protein